MAKKWGNWTPDQWREHVEDVIEEVHYRMHLFANAKTVIDQGEAASRLHNAVHDLSTWHRGYDEERGTLPWERDDEAGA